LVRHWQLVPQSVSEAASVSAILGFIKKAAAPDSSSIGDNLGVLIQPYVFKIVFTNPLIEKAMSFDKMALTDYSINYMAQGYSSTYKDSMPKQIELSMSFAEYGIKKRSDWTV